MASIGDKTTDGSTSPHGPTGSDGTNVNPEPLLRRAPSLVGLRTLAFVLVIVATSLYLLERLEPVLRPLLIAVLLCYLFLPVYNRLRRRMRPVFSFLLIALVITLGLQGLARLVYRDVVMIDSRLPRYIQREAELENYLRELTKSIVPRLPRGGQRGIVPARRELRRLGSGQARTSCDTCRVARWHYSALPFLSPLPFPFALSSQRARWTVYDFGGNVTFDWSVTDLLRGPYKLPQYGRTPSQIDVRGHGMEAI